MFLSLIGYFLGYRNAIRKYIIEKVTQAVIYLRKNLSEVASNYVN
ncbi:hypothetical protein OTSKATO_0135 [Orientia tsutsugamushi str. Kato PP]|uniref:Uncharacterized protein n=2 Tax=Orientia tsutsugamushi TaxID=784 RepID=B3CT23_ORITI|nr:hypothetical protein OTSKATO_0135 [Orientia tsutsugamushi str. Kato PP]BAG40520.1 hypothetical protein OTT_1062 [Orientia tsutsugamushi str. Ikeda]SPR13120.1 Uncharacterised protein [Orientia tsutsugamushi]